MFGAITKALLALWIMTWAGHAQAQWKTIPCSDLKFTVSIQFTDCQYERSYATIRLSGFFETVDREIYGGYFHDENSSLAVAVYSVGHSRGGGRGGLPLEDGDSYALGADAYRPFFAKYPAQKQIIPQGKWLSFPAVVKAPTGNRTMKCLQFFKGGPPTRTGYLWTMVALMCVNEGEVPESAADLILNSIQVNLKY
jgi:hypothetical protein